MTQEIYKGIKEAEHILDNLNGEHGEKGRLCLFCSAGYYNTVEGVEHEVGCVIRQLRTLMNIYREDTRKRT